MNYISNENDISSTVKDFEALCAYIIENKPKLTPKGALSTKACFELNSLMTIPETNAKKTHRMSMYPSIALYFLIAQNTGLLEDYLAKWQTPALTLSESYMDFKEMSVYSKYLFIFLAWMRYADTNELYEKDLIRSISRTSEIDRAFEQIGKMDKSATVNREANSFFSALREDHVQALMNGCAAILHHLRDLCIIMYDAEDVEKMNTYFNVVNKITITEFGIALTAACSARRFSWINLLDSRDIYLDNDKGENLLKKKYDKNPPGTDGFIEPFLSCFPKNKIDAEKISRLVFSENQPVLSDEKTIYEFKVALGRRCHRVIQCRGSHTFDDLHSAIQNAFDFDNDHLYAFFMDGKKWSRRSLNSPYSEEPPFADEINIASSGLRVKQKILYLFDFGDEWLFDVTLASIKESETILLRPMIKESVGKAPEQYSY